MKRIKLTLALCLCALLCVACLLLVAAAPSKVYVSAKGSDSNSGESASSAVKTIEKAFSLMPSGGKIILCGESYSFEKNYSFPKSDKKYTLTSEMTGDVTFSGCLNINSDFLIENVSFNGSSTPIFVCNGNNVTFGQGITNKTDSYIVGGVNLVKDDPVSKGNLTEDYTIEVQSGSWVNFFGGNRRAVGSSPTSKISGDITIVIDGAVFRKTGTALSENQNNVSGMNSTEGDLTLKIKSGEIWGSIFAIGRIGTDGKKTTHKGDINIEITGGLLRNVSTNATAALKGNGMLDICQDATTVTSGDYSLKITNDATVDLKEIKTTGVLGMATMDVPASIVPVCHGFVRNVYVGGNGSDSNTGTSPADAYKTLSRAVEAISTSGGTVIVCGDVTVSEDTTLKAVGRDIIITSAIGNENYKSKAKLTVNAALSVSSSVTFDDITLAGNGTIYACGNTVIAEAGVACDGKLNVSASAPSGEKSSGGEVVLIGGSYGLASAGSVGGKGASSVSNTIVSVEGATVRVLCVSGGNDISGSSVASILSGTVTEGIYGIYGTDKASVGGSAIVEIAGGKISGKISAVAEGVSGEAAGKFELSLLGGDVSGVGKISGAGFASSKAKVEDAYTSKIENFKTVAKEIVLYVCDGGKGSRNGSSAENAAASITDVMNIAGKDNDATIVVCGPLKVPASFVEPAHSGKYILTSRYAGTDYRRLADAHLEIAGNYTASGDVSFDDVRIVTDGKTRVFIGGGHPIAFGAGVSCEIVGTGSTYPYIFGGIGTDAGSVKSASVTVNGGTWQRVDGGNRYVNTYVLGNISVNIGGGHIVSYVTGTGKSNVKGDIVIKIDGGSIRNGVFAIHSSQTERVSVEGNIEIHLNGGVVKGKVCAARVDSNCILNGNYTCFVNQTNLDSVTDVRGAANISGKSVSKITYGKGVSYSQEVEGTVEIKNPICSGADPWVIYHNGFYYMAVARGGGVTVAKAANVSELGEAEQVVVWKPTASTGLSNSLWSPELHYFSKNEFGAEHEGWYLYIAVTPADDADNNAKRRCYALMALTDDPQGSYGSPVDKKLDMAVQIKMDKDNTNWNIGPSIFRIEGKIYMTWTGREYIEGVKHRQNLNIAEMVNPYTLNLDHSGIICWPTESWEKHGATYSGATIYPEVVEGATAVYGKNGEVYCIYSASGYWTSNYALAQLKFKGGDPCDINNWEKSKQPIFTQNQFVYGPGHASYVKSPDGETNYFIYHGYPTSAKESRYVYIETFTVDSTGVHLGSGKPADVSLPIVIKKNHLPLSRKISCFGESGKTDVNVPGNTGESVDTGAVTTQPAADQSSESSSLWIIIVVAVAVVVVGGGVVAFILLKKKAK